ncbi:MAG: phage tail protein [Aeromonadaceae bacterium]
MSQVITNAFEQYWQSCLAAEQPVVLDEFILADIPNLDITSPIDPETGLPPESQIVHRQNVDQRGRINNNAVAYTIVMDTTVGDFSFNAMYLRNKANGVIGMIVYKGRETKLKTDQTTGQTGNSLVKSMLMGYDQAAEATLTHVDAGTWQIDYAARLRGMDEDIRQLQADLYGHHTFVGDGFKVVEKDGAYQVTQGVAIVGGLRVELKAPEVIHPGTKPIGVWVDVHRAGSLLSEHQNHFNIITSVADLTDHVDSNGYQHYVAKLGTILADSTIEDGRDQGGGGAVGVVSTKTPEDFEGTDQEKIEAWLSSGGNLEIYRDYHLTSGVVVAVSGIRVRGSGRIIFNEDVEGLAALEIVGNENKLYDFSVLHQGDMRSVGVIVKLTGNGNRADDIESAFLKEFNPVEDGEQYSGACIYLDGDCSSAVDNHGFNGGSGVVENGKNNLLLRNHFDDCCRIAVNGNKSRDGIVDGNHGDCNHKGYPLQGCDGIWGNRSHRFTKYSNNTIKNPGEHGAYLQGDGFVWDKTNRVEGAKKCILKVGAKKDGNFSYPGEELPKFDEFGLPDVNGVYATTGAHISPRGSGNNLAGVTDGCVCLQPNIADINLDGYEIIDNPDSPFGIRSLYFFDGSENQVLSNIRVGKGKVLRSGPSSLACAAGLEVDGFYSGRHLNITAAQAPHGTTDVTITAECPYVDFTSSPSDINMVGGKYRYILESTGVDIKLVNVTLTNQEAGGGLSHGRVRKIQGGVIRWNGLDVFNINGVTDVLGVTFEIPDCSVSYPIQFNFGADSPLQGHFDGNTIKAPLSKRPVRIGGKDATCNSNVVVAAANADYSLTIQGENVVAMGNSLNAGAVRLDASAKGCFVVGKTVSNGNEAGGNVIISG